MHGASHMVPQRSQQQQADGAQMSAQQIMQMNMDARNACTGRGLDMIQQVASQIVTTYIAGQPFVINFPARNVGMIKRFFIEIVADIGQVGAETHTLQPLGPSAILSNVNFTDLSNQARINTTGWHLHMLATFRRQLAFGAAFTNDSPVSMGSNYNVIKAPATVNTGSQKVYMVYEVPLAYGDMDLRGAVYANVVNATMNLQLTINPNFFASSAANAVQSVYKSSSAQLGKINSITVNLYQNYLDQLPSVNGQPYLPQMDLSTVYLLNNTNANGLAVGADQAIPYANFRNFLSTIIGYDNNGTLNPGTDINYFAMQSANFTNLFKMDPQMASLLTRTKINDDLPAGFYYFDHRLRPLSTIQYGNMQLIVNPSVVTSANQSQLLVGYESLAMMNTITQAGSLFQS